MKTIKIIIVLLFIMGISVPTVFLNSCSDGDTQESDIYTLAQTRAGGINDEIAAGCDSIPVNSDYGNFIVHVEYGAGIIGDIQTLPKIEESYATPPNNLPEGVRIPSDSIRVTAKFEVNGYLGVIVKFWVYDPNSEKPNKWDYQEKKNGHYITE